MPSEDTKLVKLPTRELQDSRFWGSSHMLGLVFGDVAAFGHPYSVSDPLNLSFTQMDFGGIATLICFQFPVWDEHTSISISPWNTVTQKNEANHYTGRSSLALVCQRPGG